ncbi:MAG: hypothetical protein MJ193_05050 [Clostridia bacterium]|nr:hypothetical protein [Clostridia bacterium]
MAEKKDIEKDTLKKSKDTAKKDTLKKDELKKPTKARSSKAKSSKAPKVEPTTKKLNSNRLELMICIVNREKAEYYVDLIQSHGGNLQTTVLAYGTAREEAMHLLGMEYNNKKMVIFSIIKEEEVPKMLASLEKKFASIKNGKGVAFTVPFSSVIGVAIFGFLSDNRKTVKEQ